MPSTRRSPIAQLTTLGLAAALLGSSGCASLIGGTRHEVQRAPREKLLHVTSTPPGADVLFGDRWLGVTPVTVPLDYEVERIRTYRDLSAGGSLWLPFFPVGTALGIAFILYDGSEDGELVGVAEQAREHHYELRVSKDGYAETVRLVRVPRDGRIHVSLNEAAAGQLFAPAPGAASHAPARAGPTPSPSRRSSAQAPDRPTGELRLAADPSGLRVTVEAVDSAAGHSFSMAATTPVTVAVPAGRYRVRVDDPRYAAQTTEVEVEADARLHLHLVPRQRGGAR